jgi:serine/threonine protein kinase
MPPSFDGALLASRWRLGPRLGGASQGHTYLARDERKPEQTVVVKKLVLSAEEGWKRFDLFEREVKVLKELSHPGIPRLLETFEDPPGTYCLVMERAPGVTLRSLAKKVRFSEDELRDVAARVLDIVAYLHSRKPAVIHRDLKPANILRAPDGRVSVVDFGGVAASLREDGGSTVVGTFGYMAPEQLHGASTPATDLYGLGATIVALAGGIEPERVPRKGLRMDLKKHLPSMDPSLRDVLERMTDPDPEGRPASAVEAKKLIQARKPLRAEAPAAEPLAKATPHVETEELFDFSDGSVPPPLRAVLRVALMFMGILGSVSLWAVDVLIVPFIYAIARAFSARQKWPRLGASEKSTRRFLREGRDGFRAMRRRSLAGPRKRLELPPVK